LQTGAPEVLEPASMVQALAFTGRALGPSRRHCQAQPKRLIVLPEVPARIIELRSGGHVLPASAHSWVSGSNVVSLAGEAARQRGPLCIVYVTSGRPELAVADSKHGLRLISLQ
jgi:hypothetical protein